MSISNTNGINGVTPKNGVTAARSLYDFEARLKNLREITRLFPAGSINDLCSVPISTKKWGISSKFPNQKTVHLFEALENYVGPVAGDKKFSGRMDAVTHTLWLIESLERIAQCHDPISTRNIFSGRGTTKNLHLVTEEILKINQLYRSLDEEHKKILYVGALLHDIGKATGNRERHPYVGAEKFKETPALFAQTRQLLPPLKEAESFIQFLIGKHELISSLVITHDHNFFECLLEIIKFSPEPSKKEKLLALLAVCNFADIDAQGPYGIFTPNKLTTFLRTHEKLKQLLVTSDPAAKSIEDLAQKKDLLWWGQKRALAWARGDMSEVSDEQVLDLIKKILPDEQKFYADLGKIGNFDGMFNLSTFIHHPPTVLKFLNWVGDLASKKNIHHISYDLNFITGPEFVNKLTAASQIEKAVDLTFIEIDGRVNLRFSLNQKT